MPREARTGSKTNARVRVKAEALLEQLKEVAQRIGLQVREEKLLREVGYRVRSGVCRLHDRNIVLLDREQPVAHRLDVLAEVVASRDLGGVFVSPELRRFLGQEDAAEEEPLRQEPV